MRRTHRLIIAGAGTFVVVFSGLAFAQVPWAGARIAEDRPPPLDPQLQKVYAEQEKQLNVAPPPSTLPPGPRLEGPAMRSAGRLEGVEDGRLLFSVPVTDETAPTWASRVTSRSEVGDNTIFDGRLFVRYPIAPAAEALRLEAHTGRDAELELQRSAEGEPFVVFARYP